MVRSHGLTGRNIRDTGRIIRCMERECSNGQMAGFTKAITWTIRSKEWERSHGQMEEFMRECGKMERSMVRESTKGRMISGRKGTGRAGKESSD